MTTDQVPASGASRPTPKQKRTLLFCGAALAGAVLLPAAAHAQCTEDPTTPLVNCNPGGSTIITNSNTQSLTFAPATVTTINATAFNTEIIGKLNGGSLYDQSFAAAFSDATTQAGVTAARAAITTAGGPGVVIAAPVLRSQTTSNSSVSTSLYSLDPAAPIVTFSQDAPLFGPGTVNATIPVTSGGVSVAGNPANPNLGFYQTCTATGLPTTKPSCMAVNGGVVQVNAGQTEFDSHIDTNFLVDTATTTTVTTTTNAIYDIEGTSVQNIGTVHAAVAEAGFDQAERFGRRLLNGSGYGDAPLAPGSNARLWLEPYGSWSTTGASGGIPGNRRDGYGVNGGVTDDLSDAWRVGAAIDYGSATISEAAVGERADFDMTQIGLEAAWHSGPWFVALVGTYGWAHASTSVAPVGVGATALASYRPTASSGSAETGRGFVMGSTTLTPSVGAAYEQVQSGGFTETGSGLDLVGQSVGVDRYKGWVGLTSDTRWPSGPGTLDLVVYARAIGIGGDRQVALPVVFAGGTTPLTIDGISTGSFGGDLGVSFGYHAAGKVSAYIAYDAQLRDHFTGQTASVGARMSF